MSPISNLFGMGLLAGTIAEFNRILLGLIHRTSNDATVTRIYFD